MTTPIPEITGTIRTSRKSRSIEDFVIPKTPRVHWGSSFFARPLKKAVAISTLQSVVPAVIAIPAREAL
jgi:hypothetical protein